MDRTQLLGKEKITRLLLKYSVPSIVGMVVSALYNVVDSYFVGNYVGQIGLTAVSFAMPVMIVQMAVGFMIGIGALTLISIRIGEKRVDEAERIMNSSLVLHVLFGLAVIVLAHFFLVPVLKVMGAEAEALPYCYDFTYIITLGTVFMFVGWGLNAYMRGEGSPKMSMLVMLFAAVINACLNPLFIVYFNMGIKGSATATVVTQFLTAIIGIGYFSSAQSIMKIRWRYLKISFSYTKEILLNGMPQFLIQTASGVVVIIYNGALYKFGGDVAVAAGGIVNRISMLFFMPIFGINQGAQPILGFNYGAKHFHRVIETWRKAVIFAVIIATAGFLLTRLIPAKMVGFFCLDPQLIAVGTHGLILNLFFMPFIGYQIVTSMFFQSIGKPKISSVLTLSRQMIILIPALFVMPVWYKLDGVWLAGPVADMLAALITTVFALREINLLKHKQRKIDAERVAQTNCSDEQMPDTRAI